MSTDTDIANIALSHLGEAGTVSSIDPPEGSPQAVHMSRLYPIARDALLEAYPWNFSTRRTTPAQLTPETSSYRFAYQLPNNALCVFSVLPPEADGDYVASFSESATAQGVPELSTIVSTSRIPKNYVIETLTSGQRVIYTNVENAVIRYAARVIDTTKYSPMFVNCLSRLLASYAAGPIIKGARGREEAKFQYQMFRQEFGIAQTSDANQGRQYINHVPTWTHNR